MQNVKQFVIANVNPDDYYKRLFPQWNPKSTDAVECCFHSDGSKPNLRIGLRNGGAHCHSSSCGISIGNIVHFEAERLRIRESIAARKVYRRHIRPIVDSKLIARFSSNLFSNLSALAKVKSEMGLSLREAKRFGLGLDDASNRITIPVYDECGQCVNIRYYRLPSERRPSDKAKLYNHTVVTKKGKESYGKLDLFSWPEIDKFKINEPLLLMASEKETMLARTNGWQAMCSTNGEGSWDDSWNSLIKDRVVVLVFDDDEGGRAAASRLLKQFATIAKSVIDLRLPWKRKRPDWKDYADWIIRARNTDKHFRKLVRKATRNLVRSDRSVPSSTKRSASSTTRPTPSVKDGPKLPKLFNKEYFDVASIKSRPELLNHRIKVKGIVAAKATDTYSLPWRFAVKIPSRPEFEYKLELGRDLLCFVHTGDASIIKTIRTLLGSDKAEISPLEYITANEVEIIPTAVADSDAPYSTQRCYYIGDSIEANIPYDFELTPVAEIKSQRTIGIISKCVPLSRTTDRFDLTPENFADLSIFQPTEGEDPWAKLQSVANVVAHKFTRVYNRLDWTIAALLTWCCPIGWRFPDEPDIQRGWLNTLALGDTETGKSKVCKALRNVFNCGAFVSGENCTFVGLVGGAIKTGGDRLMLRWGRIPLSDKQLVVLEELSGLSVEEISNMSDVRSSGVARLDKGGINSETNSRTRLLCLSNVRKQGKSLSNYLFGVHAVHELIGHGEDIARFDLITTLTDREVSVDVINSKHFASIANGDDVASDQLQKLVHFIWSLTPDQIHFTKDSYEKCLSETKRLSGIYHPSIPIFKGGSGRYKLARLAAAIACFQFCWNSDQNRIDVQAKHVTAASKLLELIYCKASLGYSEYSRQMFDRETVKDSKAIRKTIRSRIPTSRLAKVLETLIHSTRFTRDELQAIGGTTALYADEIIGVMVRERALRKGDSNVWEITPAGKVFMEQFIEKLKTTK